MSAEIEIVGGAGDYEAAAIVAAIQAIFSEEDARAKQLTTTSRWRIELKAFEPGRWGLDIPEPPPEDS
ncbi:MAG: hypothetical protein HKO82_09070 [Acidimicrobiia bacterium]|nr:hypothetical protein [Acidimicrobiia bacterium]